jgi:hypothetical protein
VIAFLSRENGIDPEPLSSPSEVKPHSPTANKPLVNSTHSRIMTYTQDPTMTVPPGPLHGLPMFEDHGERCLNERHRFRIGGVDRSLGRKRGLSL